MTNRQKDILCSVVFLVFGAVMLYLSFGVRHKIAEDVGSGYVPKFIAILILITSGAKLVLSVRDKSEAGKKKQDSDSDLLGGLGTIGLMLAYMMTLKPLGFILSSAVYLFLQILLMSNKDNRKLVLFGVIGVVLPVAIYALFNYVIKMPLPKGILGF